MKDTTFTGLSLLQCRFLLSCKVHYDPAHCPPSVNLSECDPSQGKMSRRRPMIAGVVLWHSMAPSVWHRQYGTVSMAPSVWHRLIWHRLVWHRHIASTYIHPMALADDAVSEFNLALPQIRISTIQRCNCSAAYLHNRCMARVLPCVPSLLDPASTQVERFLMVAFYLRRTQHPPTVDVTLIHLRELSSDFCEATMKKTRSSF